MLAPIPLLGFTGATEYYPTRVIRQYQVVQELPPALQADPLRVSFIDGDRGHEDSILTIKSMWDMCQPRKLKWPEEELKGKEMKYYASIKYIQQHKNPEELLPKMPKVPLKITNRAKNKRLKRVAEKAKEENKRLRRVVSRVYIDQAR